MCQHEREHQGDIIAHGDPRSLESVVCGHHVYKYIWTPCLGERLSLRTDVGNLYDSYHTMLFGDKRCEMVGNLPRIICSAMIAVFM